MSFRKTSTQSGFCWVTLWGKCQFDDSGGIASLYSNAYPADFAKIGLVAPMHQVNTGKFGPVMIQILNAGTWVTGMGDNFAVGERTKWTYVPWKSSLAGSEVRYENNQAYEMANPAVQIAGVTYHWIGTTDKRTRQFVAKASPLLRNPSLILQATTDTAVVPAAQSTVCGKSPSCTLVPYTTATHNMLWDKDSIRDDVFLRLKAFFV